MGVYGVSQGLQEDTLTISSAPENLQVCVLQEKILRPLWQVFSVLRMTSMCKENDHMIITGGVSGKGLIMEGFITLASVVLV